MRSVEQNTAEHQTKAAIKQAAIEQFGRNGFAGTGVRSIAASVGVSAALVLHHFGSKEGLRRACDDYLTTLIRESKEEAMKQGPPADPLALLHDLEGAQPAIRYLARMLVDGSEGIAELVDNLVADAVRYTDLGVANGVLLPTEHPYERTVVLTLWQLGAMTLHEHAKRLLGVDLLDDPRSMIRWSRPAMELLTRGLFVDDRWAQAVASVDQDDRDNYKDQKQPNDTGSNDLPANDGPVEGVNK